MTTSHDSVASNVPLLSIEQLDHQRGVIKRLEHELQLCYDRGLVDASGSIAQQITSETIKLKQLQSQYDLQQSHLKNEQRVINVVMSRIEESRVKVEDRRLDIIRLQDRLKGKLFNSLQEMNSSSNQKPNKSNKSSSSSSSSLSWFSSKTGISSTSSPNNTNLPTPSLSPSDVSSLLSFTRKNIREQQVLLEQQCLFIDSIDLHNDSQLTGSSELSSSSQALIKSIRKDNIQNIQRVLSHVDQFEAHLKQFEQFINFLQQHPAPNYSPHKQ